MQVRHTGFPWQQTGLVPDNPHKKPVKTVDQNLGLKNYGACDILWLKVLTESLAVRLIQTAILSFVASFLANSALCQNIEASNPKSILSAIQELGFQAKLLKDSFDDPMIESASEGSKFNIYFDGCSSHVCNMIYFNDSYKTVKSDYPVLRPVVDNWNSKSVFSKATVNDDLLSLSYYIDLSQGGLSKELFNSNFNRWIGQRVDFRNNIAGAYEGSKK